MCNVFDTGKKLASLPGKKMMLEAFSREIERLTIRRTDRAPVMLADGEVKMMRWGFERHGLGTINNTRADNLDSKVWAEAYASRRCLIPMVGYYEWSGGKGHKRTHRFSSPQSRWLWVAGIWEKSEELGSCFSMLTTEANRLVTPIHHRMPAVLSSAEFTPYLEAGLDQYAPDPEILRVEEAANPLLKNPPSHIQEDLL